MLTRVLGLNDKVEIYITPVKPNTGDVVLMCSDGLTNYLPERSVETILDDPSMTLERKANIMIEEANNGGGGDNISVILLEVMEEGRWVKFKRMFISE